MARIRTIKPEFFEDEAIAELPIGARLLFIGMWGIADKAGRLRDSPRWIRSRVFPYETAHPVDAWLDLLHVAQFIQRYVVDGVGYIQIRTFAKHQRPHLKELPSSIPELPSTYLAPTQVGAEHNLNPAEHLPSTLGREGKEYWEGKGMDDGEDGNRGSSSSPHAPVTPLVQRRRLNAVFEGPRVYVLKTQHHRFVRLRNHPEAERELFAWYEQVSDDWTTGPHARDNPGTDMVPFWTDRFNERWPPLKAATQVDNRPEWVKRAKAQGVTS